MLRLVLLIVAAGATVAALVARSTGAPPLLLPVIVIDGESNRLEGAPLIATHPILAVASCFLPAGGGPGAGH
jgi:hypothetical protein